MLSYHTKEQHFADGYPQRLGALPQLKRKDFWGDRSPKIPVFHPP
jgi:hypothetical protein